MTATWYLVRHVPNLKRREPRNVGLLLKTPDGWLTRFMGEEPNGSINGRKLPHSTINTDVYKTWVEYYRRKIASDDWDGVERMQGRRMANYFAELGGHMAGDHESWKDVLNRLYADLVEVESAKQKQPRETVLDHLLHGVEQVFSAAGVMAQREVKIDAKFKDDGPLTKVPFRFLIDNGQAYLMDLVHERHKPEQAAAEARELRARVDAARRAGSARTFVAFYASSLLPDSELDQILMPVEEVSETVDVDDLDDATDKIQGLVAR